VVERSLESVYKIINGFEKLFFKYIFAADAIISHSNTQTMNLRAPIHFSIATSSLKPYTLAGFEPRSSVPESDAWTSKM
jgi:hypothetical protein